MARVARHGGGDVAEVGASPKAKAWPLAFTASKPCPLKSGIRPVMGLFMVDNAGEPVAIPTWGASPKP